MAQANTGPRSREQEQEQEQEQEEELHPGDHVLWRLGVGEAIGQVVEKITEDKKIGGRTFHARPDDPRYLVKSDTSGKEAVRKPESLHKLSEAEEEEARQRHSHSHTSHISHSSHPHAPAPAHGRRTSHHHQPQGSKGGGGDNVVSMVMETDDMEARNDPTYEPDAREEEREGGAMAREDDAALESLPSDKKLLTELEKEAAQGGGVV